MSPNDIGAALCAPARRAVHRRSRQLAVPRIPRAAGRRGSRRCRSGASAPPRSARGPARSPRSGWHRRRESGAARRVTRATRSRMSQMKAAMPISVVMSHTRTAKPALANLSSSARQSGSSTEARSRARGAPWRRMPGASTARRHRARPPRKSPALTASTSDCRRRARWSRRENSRRAAVYNRCEPSRPAPSTAPAQQIVALDPRDHGSASNGRPVRRTV